MSRRNVESTKRFNEAYGRENIEGGLETRRLGRASLARHRPGHASASANPISSRDD
jgi:hypothetical protein